MRLLRKKNRFFYGQSASAANVDPARLHVYRFAYRQHQSLDVLLKSAAAAVNAPWTLLINIGSVVVHWF
jgi:hypothetical protein